MKSIDPRHTGLLSGSLRLAATPRSPNTGLPHRARIWKLGAGLAAAALTGCGSVPAAPAARMAVPDAQAALAPLAMGRLPPSRQGEFEWLARKGRFERQADRLSLFDPALEFDKVGLRYSLAAAAEGAVEAQCRGRRVGATLGTVVLTPRPLEVRCIYSGAFTGTLTVNETASADGKRVARRGRLQSAGIELEVSSVHRVEGSPLLLAFPIGYTFASAGHTVGALEVNGSTSRLWIDPALTSPALPAPAATASAATAAGAARVHEALLHTALTLALLWDPARAHP